MRCPARWISRSSPDNLSGAGRIVAGQPLRMSRRVTRRAMYLPCPLSAVTCYGAVLSLSPIYRSQGIALVELSDRSGLVSARHDSFDGLVAIAPTVFPATWSGPFRVTASDGRDYFVKTLETCPAGQAASLAIEQVVSRAGQLIGAPVCETSLIRIPAVLEGWEPRPGVRLQAGLAHASLAIEHADFRRPPLDERDGDDNSRRHVGVYALCHWCFSADEQWLYDLDNDHALYSHDHGLYLPPPGAGWWTQAELVAQADTSHSWRDPSTNLSRQAASEFADALENVDRASLVKMMCVIPASWPVTNDALEGLGWFLGYRAPAVAARIRALV